MQSRFKKMPLEEVYRILEMMTKESITLKYPIEVRKLNNGLGFKMFSAEEQVTIYMYPQHATSEISVIRKNMRYIYPRRDLRIKKHHIEDLMNIFIKDERLLGCHKLIENYLIEILKIEHADVIESVYLG